MTRTRRQSKREKRGLSTEEPEVPIPLEKIDMTRVKKELVSSDEEEVEVPMAVTTPSASAPVAKKARVDQLDKLESFLDNSVPSSPASTPAPSKPVTRRASACKKTPKKTEKTPSKPSNTATVAVENKNPPSAPAATATSTAPTTPAKACTPAPVPVRKSSRLQARAQSTETPGAAATSTKTPSKNAKSTPSAATTATTASGGRSRSRGRLSTSTSSKGRGKKAASPPRVKFAYLKTEQESESPEDEQEEEEDGNGNDGRVENSILDVALSLPPTKLVLQKLKTEECKDKQNQNRSAGTINMIQIKQEVLDSDEEEEEARKKEKEKQAAAGDDSRRASARINDVKSPLRSGPPSPPPAGQLIPYRPPKVIQAQREPLEASQATTGIGDEAGASNPKTALMAYSDPPTEDLTNLNRSLSLVRAENYTMREHLQTSTSDRSKLVEDNIRLRNQITKLNIEKRMEKERAEAAWRRVDQMELFSKAKEHGAEQRFFLANKFEQKVKIIKDGFDTRLKAVETDRIKLARENEVLSRKTENHAKILKRHKRTVRNLKRILAVLMKTLERGYPGLEVRSLLGEVLADEKLQELVMETAQENEENLEEMATAFLKALGGRVARISEVDRQSLPEVEDDDDEDEEEEQDQDEQNDTGVNLNLSEEEFEEVGGTNDILEELKMQEQILSGSLPVTEEMLTILNPSVEVEEVEIETGDNDTQEENKADEEENEDTSGSGDEDDEDFEEVPIAGLGDDNVDVEIDVVGFGLGQQEEEPVVVTPSEMTIEPITPIPMSMAITPMDMAWTEGVAVDDDEEGKRLLKEIIENAKNSSDGGASTIGEMMEEIVNSQSDMIPKDQAGDEQVITLPEDLNLTPGTSAKLGITKKDVLSVALPRSLFSPSFEPEMIMKPVAEVAPPQEKEKATPAPTPTSMDLDLEKISSSESNSSQSQQNQSSPEDEEEGNKIDEVISGSDIIAPRRRVRHLSCSSDPHPRQNQISLEGEEKEEENQIVSDCIPPRPPPPPPTSQEVDVDVDIEKEESLKMDYLKNTDFGSDSSEDSTPPIVLYENINRRERRRHRKQRVFRNKVLKKEAKERVENSVRTRLMRENVSEIVPVRAGATCEKIKLEQHLEKKMEEMRKRKQMEGARASPEEEKKNMKPMPKPKKVSFAVDVQVQEEGKEVEKSDFEIAPVPVPQPMPVPEEKKTEDLEELKKKNAEAEEKRKEEEKKAEEKRLEEMKIAEERRLEELKKKAEEAQEKWKEDLRKAEEKRLEELKKKAEAEEAELKRKEAEKKSSDGAVVTGEKRKEGGLKKMDYFGLKKPEMEMELDAQEKPPPQEFWKKPEKLFGFVAGAEDKDKRQEEMRLFKKPKEGVKPPKKKSRYSMSDLFGEEDDVGAGCGAKMPIQEKKTEEIDALSAQFRGPNLSESESNMSSSSSSSSEDEYEGDIEAEAESNDVSMDNGNGYGNAKDLDIDVPVPVQLPKKVDRYKSLFEDLNVSGSSSSDEDDEEEEESALSCPASPEPEPEETDDTESYYDGYGYTTVDGKIFSRLEKMMSIPGDQLTPVVISKFIEPLRSKSAEKIIPCIYALIANTDGNDSSAAIVKEERITRCPLAPRFLKLFQIMKTLASMYPRICLDFLIFLERIMRDDKKRELERGDLLENLGRFVGALSLEESLGDQCLKVIFAFALYRGPHIFPFVFGVLCSDSNIFGYILNGFHSLPVESRGLIFSLVRSVRWGNSVWSGKVSSFVVQSLQIEVPEVSFDAFYEKIVGEFKTLESQREIERYTKVLAMLIVQRGWQWFSEKIVPGVHNWMMEWKDERISDGIFSAYLDNVIGFAAESMRRVDVPEDVSTMLKVLQAVAKVSNVIPKMISNAAQAALYRIQGIKLRPKNTPPELWYYEKRRDPSRRGNSSGGGGGAVGGSGGRKKKNKNKKRKGVLALRGGGGHRPGHGHGHGPQGQGRGAGGGNWNVPGGQGQGPGNSGGRGGGGFFGGRGGGGHPKGRGGGGAWKQA